jgi:hypothetical protein
MLYPCPPTIASANADGSVGLGRSPPTILVCRRF